MFTVNDRIISSFFGCHRSENACKWLFNVLASYNVTKHLLTSFLADKRLHIFVSVSSTTAVYPGFWQEECEVMASASSNVNLRACTKWDVWQDPIKELKEQSPQKLNSFVD